MDTGNQHPYAEARTEVFRPKLVRLSSPDNPASGYVSPYAYISLMSDLMKFGMPTGLVCLFMQMLWQAHPGLDNPIYGATLATLTGKKRPNVRRSIKELQKIGVISEVEPVTRPASWRFQKYHDLIESVKAAYGTGGLF